MHDEASLWPVDGEWVVSINAPYLHQPLSGYILSIHSGRVR